MRTLRTINKIGDIERVAVHFSSEEYHGSMIHYNSDEQPYPYYVLKDGLYYSFKTRKEARAKVDEKTKIPTGKVV